MGGSSVVTGRMVAGDGGRYAQPGVAAAARPGRCGCAGGAAAVGGAGGAADQPRPAGDGGRQRLGAQGEGGCLGAAGDQAGGGLVGAQVGQVVGGQVRRVWRSRSRASSGLTVKMTWERALAEMPCAQVGGELGEVLVGHGDRQPVGAGLGEHVFQRVGQVEEVLAFVDVQARVRRADAGGGGRGGRRPARSGDDERPDELRGFLAEDAFGQPGQAQPAVVEDLGHGRRWTARRRWPGGRRSGAGTRAACSSAARSRARGSLRTAARTRSRTRAAPGRGSRR